MRGEVEGAKLEEALFGGIVAGVEEELGGEPDEEVEEEDVDAEGDGHASCVCHAGFLQEAAEEVRLGFLRADDACGAEAGLAGFAQGPVLAARRAARPS